MGGWSSSWLQKTLLQQDGLCESSAAGATLESVLVPCHLWKCWERLVPSKTNGVWRSVASMGTGSVLHFLTHGLQQSMVKAALQHLAKDWHPVEGVRAQFHALPGAAIHFNSIFVKQSV